MTSENRRADRAELRRAVERLLVWGFPPASIAKQLGCSQSWVYEIRREQAAYVDIQVEPGSLLNLLGEYHS